MNIAFLIAALLAGSAQQGIEPTAKAFVFDEKNSLFDFQYAWPAEAATVPQLAKHLRMNMEKERTEFIALAERDRGNPDSLGYSYSTDYITSGQSVRLLSLRIDYVYRPGSLRENWGSGILLWDRLTATEIEVADLFMKTSDMSDHLTRRWCTALINGEDFEDCPRLDWLTIIPTDKNGNGRFETLTLVAPADIIPYAHSEVELAVTADLIAALKSDYRASFEIGQPQ